MYDDVDDLWVELLGQLLGKGNKQSSRDGDVRGEIVGYSVKLDASKQKTLVTTPGRKLSASYAAAETLWYMSGTAETEMIKHYAPSYSRYESMDGTAYGAYGARLAERWVLEPGDQRQPSTVLENAVRLLQAAGMTRQCVIGIWDPHDLPVALSGECRDVPCTLSWQFLLRDDKLDMVVTMRSNDAWLGFPYDVFAFTCFQRVVAAELGCQVGTYHHNVGSMHLYERHAVRAWEIVKSKPWRRPRAPGHGWGLTEGLDSCQIAVAQERHLREGTGGVGSPPPCSGSMLHDMVLACASKCLPIWSCVDLTSERIKRCLSYDSTSRPAQ